MRGKKTDNETIYKIMISMFNTNNFNETARLLNIPVKTVETIYKKNIAKEEFAKLRIEKTEEFIEKANRIIDKATSLLEKRLDTAIERQDELEELIDNVYNTDNKEIAEQKKRAIVSKISDMQINKISELTTAVGTIYDKRALAKGDSTANENIIIKVNIVDE